MLAKQVATVDFLTSGRFTLGTAVGHMEPEFDVMGVSFKERGKIADESLEVMKECWTADRPSFDGPYTKFDDIAFEPSRYRSHTHRSSSEAIPNRHAPRGEVWRWVDSLADHGSDLPAALDYLRAQPGFEEKADTFEIIMRRPNTRSRITPTRKRARPKLRETGMASSGISKRCRRLA